MAASRSKSRSSGSSSRGASSSSSSSRRGGSSSSGRSSSSASSKRSSSAGASRRSGSSSSSRGKSSAPASRSRSGSSSAGGRTTRSAKLTTNHDQIRQWVEERGGHPACVRGVGKRGDVGLLRIDYPGFSGQGKLQEINWDEFFDQFEKQKLAFLYQDSKGGKTSRFSKLVDRSQMRNRDHGRSARSNGGGAKSKSSSRSGSAASSSRSKSRRGGGGGSRRSSSGRGRHGR